MIRGKYGNILDLSNFSNLTEESKKQRIDEINNYIYDNIWYHVKNKKKIIQTMIDYSEEINYTKGIAFSALNFGTLFVVQQSYEGISYLNKALILFKQVEDNKGILRSLLNLGSSYFFATLYNKSFDYLQKVVDLAKKIGDKKYLAAAYNNIGNNFQELENYSQAKLFFLNAINNTDVNSMEDSLAVMYQNYGYACLKLGEFENALEYLTKGLELLRKNNKKIVESECLNHLGEYYQINGQLDKAKEYYELAYKLDLKISESNYSIMTLSNLGQVMYLKKDYNKAKEYLIQALIISEQAAVKYKYVEIYEKLYNIERDANKLESALYYLDLYTKEIKNKYTITTESKISALTADFKFQKSEQEKEIFKLRNVELKKKSEELQYSYNNVSKISRIGYKITSTIMLEEVLDAVYEGVNSIMSADVFGIALLDKSTEEIDYRFFIENSTRVFPPRVSIHTKNSLAAKCIKQNKEIKIDDTKIILDDGAQKHKTDNPQITKSLLIIPLIAEEDIIGILTVQSYRKNQYTDYHLDMLKALGVYIASAITNSINHEKLTIAKEEADIANQEKGKYLTEILDSIRYAERIQRSMLPTPEIVKSLVPNSFFFWQPKDIVGGDAYYIEPLENGFYIALFDCTGHGIPGAMMSMVATVFLRRIIVDYKSTRPSGILKQLNIIIKNFLKQDKEETLSDDGMDAAICFIDPGEKKLVYAGARLPLYYLKTGKIIHIKGDKQSIGYKKSKNDFDFTEHEIQIEKDTIFYMSTDGYIDQIGGEKNLPFGWKRFTRLLEKNQNESLEKQYKCLKSSLKKYKGKKNPQVDDITIVGFKI